MSQPETALAAGAKAPDFTLPATPDQTVSLRELRGHPVVLVFYPGDNTPVCTRQLNAYTNDIDQFSELGAQILAVSPEGLDSHEGFA
ncbi:MAG: redoxin domain-containing protein, partial [Thermomicrobiales bacterium]|nr:redoxin domain-containing protein [Thermomicrobiales bacterium]